MNESMPNPVSDPHPALAEIVQDLAVLCDGPGVDIHLHFDGGLLAMKSHDVPIFARVAERGWKRLEAEARARTLVRWIHEAAEAYRSRAAGQTAGEKEVA